MRLTFHAVLCVLLCNECNKAEYEGRSKLAYHESRRGGETGLCRAKIIAKKKKFKPTITPFIVQACIIWN